MGGCASRPKELDGANAVTAKKSAEPEVAIKPVIEVKEETVTEPEMKEAPLVDLSEPEPEAERSEVVELAPGLSELTVDVPQTVEIKAEPVAEQVTVTAEKEEVIEDKAEVAKTEEAEAQLVKAEDAEAQLVKTEEANAEEAKAEQAAKEPDVVTDGKELEQNVSSYREAGN